MTTADVATDVDRQLANAREYWLGWGVADRSDEELVLYRSGVLHPQLNGVLRVGSGIALEEAVAQAEQRLAGVQWMWWVGPDSRPDLAGHLLVMGATEIETMPIMAVPLESDFDVEVPRELTVEEMTEPQGLLAWVKVYASSFGVTPDQLGGVLEAERGRPDEAGSFVRFAARWNDRLVGTSALLVRHDVGGVYVVTTAEDFRRRGIATALTAAALREARWRGLPVATLQASAEGEPVYRRMGFQTVAGYRMFAPGPLSSASRIA
ncbi:GNAT superfamily N-acetyltransferase [Thermocatellispora tengchongensis]|uniref:GNAT superfamily N-acetyltransferase n=1 Tax=Thermocatellispora tengchongensis TaxID=1073253 RepID=A0A840PF82_9ACTN|nr:GNAT family N-acetyltransferase [Thermocatellispora tengchongensis]MBB5136120.1 GNAT superfamily N-acetyltransferase [Thermocatellispora tengchongensis]